MCMMTFEPPACHRNRISRIFLGSEISRVHFRDSVCSDFGVKFPCFLTLIHSKMSTLVIYTCFGMLHNVLKSFEPILPSLWHSGFHGFKQVYREP